MTESRSASATRPAEGEDPHVADQYDTVGKNALERKRNPFMRSATGGRVLSTLMLPFFAARPPSGFGVITTTGRKTGKTRRKCIHAIRRDDKAYIVMIRPMITAGPSAWLLNIRADPNIRLRIRDGTFAGVARELGEGAEMQQARAAYCETVNPFDYVECTFHRSGRPRHSKIKELHRSWFDTGIPLVVELGD
jgi:deazaflavin-dependent oxidoreductase (nitroreductase family)